MPHDVNGTPLKVGDKVLIEGNIAHISEGDDYCNCTVELLHPMPPGMTKTSISSINTRQLLSDEDEPEESPNPEDLMSADELAQVAKAEAAQKHAEQVAANGLGIDPKAEDGSCAPEPKKRLGSHRRNPALRRFLCCDHGRCLVDGRENRREAVLLSVRNGEPRRVRRGSR